MNRHCLRLSSKSQKTQQNLHKDPQIQMCVGEKQSCAPCCGSTSCLRVGQPFGGPRVSPSRCYEVAWLLDEWDLPREYRGVVQTADGLENRFPSLKVSCMGSDLRQRCVATAMGDRRCSCNWAICLGNNGGWGLRWEKRCVESITHATPIW